MIQDMVDIEGKHSFTTTILECKLGRAFLARVGTIRFTTTILECKCK